MKEEYNLSVSQGSVLKENGNYLITGGMGGLGYIFARYIAKHTKGTLILTGRKTMNDEMENRFQELKKENRNVIYIPSDISKLEDVYALYQKIKGVCSNVNGILHAAGINQDSFFIRKDKEEFEQVLSAKVEGTRYLDEIFSKEKLDFFVMFSSISSVFGNVGQSDYGYANRYMDSYANLREQLRKQGLRSGKTVSINWPLWNQGMNVDDTSRAAMEDGVMGMKMLNEEEGIQAFEDALQQPSTQFIVIKGNEQGIDQMLNIDQPMKVKEENHIQQKEEQSDDILLEKVKKFVKEIVSQHTKIPVAKIKDTERFENYGIDSITIMGLTKSLEEHIGRVAKTLFFEYENVEELSEFLITTKKAEFQELFGIQNKKNIKSEKRTELKESKTAKTNTTEYSTRKWFIEKRSSQIDQKIQKETTAYKTEEDGIAIIGLSGRYPMADNIYEFWNNLLNGKDCITEIPKHRWHHEKYYDEQKGKPGKTYAKWGGFVNDIEMFDPMFFKIPPVEAEFLDPQERILLETVWEAVEDAGYTIKSLKNEKVGVFTGVMYALYQLYETKQYGGKMNGRSSFASTANRISYLFDFKGPSIALDTMCSSALTALSLACESIKNNTSTMAVVGGVNFSLHPSKYIQLSQGGFLSTDGKCRSFGEGGDGYVPGEGSGAVIIKSLKRAKEDGDHIYGVIRGIGTNAGGRTSGYTVPNLNAQRELILETLNQAEINPESISTVEAHGTGTALGDPIEIDALSQAYGKFNVPKQYCSIGSLKSNIGHLEAASGIASLTKVMLEMKYKKLVPSLHSEKQNPFILFEETPFYIQHETTDWKRLVIDGKEVPRRAAISAFGAGGANAHVIVEEYDEKEDRKDYEEEKECIFILSAKNETRLKEYAERLCNFLEIATPEIEVQSENKDTFLESVLNATANVLGVSPNSLDKKDLLIEIGIDKYAVEQIREQLLIEYPESPLSVEKMITCKTIDDLASQLNQTSMGPFIDNVSNNFEYELPLNDIAYTLQVGREPMEQRLAIVASDKETLIAGLKAYVNGEEQEKYKAGNIKDSNGKFENLLSNKGFLDYTVNELKQGKLEEVAEFWIMGADIPWEKLYEEAKPKRVSLPTYPFAKERYWIIEDDGTGCLYPDMVEEGVSTAPVKEKTYKQDEAICSNKQDIPTDNIINSKLSDDNLEEKTIEYLKNVFSTVLKIQYEYLDEMQDYEEYGIDSIYIGKLNQYLIEQFGNLPSTLFFTYKNIRLLAKYFIKEHKDKLCQMFSIEHKQEKCEVNVEEKELPEKIYTNDIAIIGISGRFPKAEGLEEYFENLRQGKDCIETIPKERWNYEDYPDIQCKWGGFIKDAEKFDPQFFNIAPVMASFMDPQERIFLEAVWSCMEDAGYTPKAMESQDEMDKRGNVAVYAGVTFNEYGLYGAGEIAQGKKSSLNSQIYSIANRISYLFNFGGPSLSVDTACSSSLYAVHLACNSIITGDADMAIAGGVNLSLHPSKYITLDWGKFLASDGHCHTFGKDGDGYVPGEGTGAVLLKPLWKAKQDNDHIYAVIKGSAVNHGGKTYGYSVPNPVAQSDVIKKAIAKSGINPRTISYIEAHGTGTSLGDPIEITALTDVYKKYTKDLQFCSIGSVKSNIGHLEAAAGISQLAKVVMQMKYKELVPSRLNSDELNPNIDFVNTPFYVQLNNEEWKRPYIDGIEYPRRAGISAFGVGGVNVHVIVEEYEEDENFKDIRSVPEKIIIPCSAKTEQALKRYLVKFLEFIQVQEKLPDLRDVAYTLTEGRIESTYRIAFVVENYEELEGKITKALRDEKELGIYTGKVSALEQKSRQDEVKSNNITDVNQKAENWVNGMPLELSTLLGDYQPKKVSLPTYSYEKEVYWMYSKEKQNTIEDDVLEEKKEEIKKQEILTQLREAYEGERLTLTIAHIQDLFAEILCFTEGRVPDAEEGFFALGLESVMTRQAMMMLEDEFKISLDEQIFFNYSNITELSGYILSHINLEAEAQQEQKEIKTLYMCEKWFDAENISFTESFGRGKIAIIAANEETKEEIISRFQKDVLEEVTFYDTSRDFALGMQGKELPDKIVFLEDVVGRNQETSIETFIEAFLYQKLQTMAQALQPVLANCKKNVCIYYFYLNTDDAISTISGSVNGLFKSLMLECANVTAKTISISQEELYEKKLIEIISNEIKVGCIDNEIRYALGKRQVRRLYNNKILSNARCKFKRNGVYLITGGLGGVGKVISKYLCETYQAKLILCGRKALDQDVKQQIREIESFGGKVTYIQADVTKKESVTNLVRRVKKSYKKINGVIHLAGTIKDALFTDKIVEDMKQLSAPKILGTYYLDQALANEDLDFFMMFSSISSVLGNSGQSDYCFANRYLDNFAELRNRQVKEGHRKGRSIVINWLFWKADGMVVDAIQEKWMEKQLGLIRMEQEQGIIAVENSLRAESEQMILFNGISQRIHEVLGIPEEKIEEEKECEKSAETAITLDADKSAKVENVLKEENSIDNLSESELIELLKQEMEIEL